MYVLSLRHYCKMATIIHLLIISGFVNKNNYYAKLIFFSTISFVCLGFFIFFLLYEEIASKSHI